MSDMRGKWIPVLVGAVLVALAVGAVVWRGRRHPVPPPAAVTAAAITAAQNEVTLQGKIRPQHITGVTASISGFIEAFLVEPGQDVYEGQVLARIGAQGLESAREVAQAALERAQEQVSQSEAVVTAARMELSRAEADAQRSRMALDRAERGRDRQQTLFREGATPRLVYEKAVKEYEAALKDYELIDATVRTGREHIQSGVDEVNGAKKIVADRIRLLEEAQDNLSAAEVHSPVDGYVVSRKGEVGGSAGLSDELFQIATDLYALEVAVEPKAEVLKRIVPGQEALVLVLDLQSAAMPGVVREIKDNQAIVEFNSTLPAIKPGMQADVRFKLE
ncbi:MAG: biotin/lipoyl-binding protein [Candidatus Solibacter sp.]|nr:biotin/lipoyl-binding protein [Candidatus Solibacter sp.]